ncbi:REP-associated tyrosine transposase [Shimia ponticola]|uniref:REP-associated tyrosine transposase n=1 Tax=Shimia ponticola TaxID=2582893 RepID=UPI0011BE83E0|nr:transposase [Shimia ponticola]
MPRYVRAHAPGGTFFFTVNLADRSSGMLVDRVADLRAAVAEVQRRRPFRIEAMVVLPDHLHAVWTLPDGDADFSTRWGAIKAGFSRRCRRAGFIPPAPVGALYGGVNPALRRKGEVGSWQPRFWEHLIRNEADYWHHMRYCAWNPVKHGYVSAPDEWPHSSVSRDARRDAE